MSLRKKPKHGHDNTGPGSPPSLPEVLIPSLPNDVALNILVRVPRQYHRILSAVSKPIRSAISSTEFFSLRSLIKCTEPLLYLTIRSPQRPVNWFVAHGRTLEQNPSNNQSTPILAPVPTIPSHPPRIFSRAVVGLKIYVFGGSAIPLARSSDVWVLDCRFHTWDRGPSMQLPRFIPKSVVLDGKIYVIGGRSDKDSSWVEVLDPIAGHWETIPNPPVTTSKLRAIECVAMGGIIRIWVSEKEELRFDPRTQTWKLIEWSKCVFLGNMCVLDGTLYRYRIGGILSCFDDKREMWKELEVATKDVPGGEWTPETSMINVGGKFFAKIRTGRKGNDQAENSEESMVEIWSAEIKGKKNEDYGELVWWEKVLSLSQSDFNALIEAPHTSLPLICTYDCLLVYL